MSKRTLSFAQLPDTKRLHFSPSPDSPRFTSSNPTPAERRLNFDNSLYDELILCIFSHLSCVDLCVAQTINRKWCRLTADNEIWRNLYLKNYGRTRLRGLKGFLGRSDGKEVRPLPTRAKAEDIKDWKWMFRVSYNWKRGRCAVEQLNPCSPKPLPSDLYEPIHQTHILLAGSLTIVASAQPSYLPSINISNSYSVNYTIFCKSQHEIAPFRVTALAIDQSPPLCGHLRLASFLSTDEFSIFSLNHINPSASHRKLTYVPNRTSPRNSHTYQAAYHHPLLITLSDTFSLSIYDLSSDQVRHTQTLTSFTSFPPASLVLSTPTSATYKLVLAYAIPVYPAHWSVGVTELIISDPGTPSTSLSLTSSSPSLHETPSANIEPMRVVSTRTIRALDFPMGWIDQDKLRSVQEQWSRKVSRVADTQTDGKWVVIAPGDHGPPPTSSASNSARDLDDAFSSYMHSSTPLQLYRLSLPMESHLIASSPPKLTFVRHLHGQTGPVSSLALADGRCVSLGLNGSLWVWDLEGGTGAEVARPMPRSADISSVPTEGAVVFDERRIISTEANRIVVRRFDV